MGSLVTLASWRFKVFLGSGFDMRRDFPGLSHYRGEFCAECPVEVPLSSEMSERRLPDRHRHQPLRCLIVRGPLQASVNGHIGKAGLAKGGLELCAGVQTESKGKDLLFPSLDYRPAILDPLPGAED